MGERFTVIEHSLLHLPAVTALSHPAFRAWVYLLEAWKRANRVALGGTRKSVKAVSFSPGHVAGGMRKKTFYAALRELEEAGLIWGCPILTDT